MLHPTLHRVLWLLLIGLAHSLAHAQDDRPNILLIIADDMGYADLGSYGSDIRTPNIDSLADGGILFTQFHASPLCATTRAMLLTGNNNAVAGLARQGSFAGPVIPGLAGYENRLSDRVAVLPMLLREAGYRTYHAGKWHLGTTLEYSPYATGFDRSYSLKRGSGNHFDDTGIRPTPDPKYFEDDTETGWPEGEYSTAFYTDKLISWLEEDRDSEQPFFMIAAYTSPHWPLQVPDEDLDLYAGHYDMGYDRLRELRFESLKSAGIIPADSRLPPRNPAIRPFDELGPDEQRLESRKMELYAAMLDNLDRHVGRLFDYLRANELFDDTLIVFFSDNGPAPEDFYYEGPYVDYIQAHYEASYERAGMRGNFLSYGPQWAEAGSAPFKLHKGYPSQGGVVSAMILKGPGVMPREEYSDVYLTVMDLAPTLLELAGASYPEDKAPMLGASAWPYLSGRADAVHDEDYVTVFTHRQYASVRQGDWKLLSLEQPFDERYFTLHNLAEDPGEAIDLSLSDPRTRAELVEIWRSERVKLGIVLPEDH